MNLNTELNTAIELSKANFAPIKKMMELLREQRGKNNAIRGEIVTALIDVEYYLDEIICLYFTRQSIGGDIGRKFHESMLVSTRTTIFTKWKILREQELLEIQDGLSSDLNLLIHIRNAAAHAFYWPNTEGYMIFPSHNDLKDINTIDDLKLEFDLIKDSVTAGLRLIIEQLEEDISSKNEP